MKLTAALIFLALLTGCGGNAVAPVAATNQPTPTSGTATTAPSLMNVVTVGAGQTASGIDVTLSSPASSPAPNAQDLGVAAITGTGTAFNTGDVIHRGQTARVLLFGPGLTGDMQVIIRGPSDISIASVTAITSTDKTPGISFIAVVDPNAALGGRTVVLQNAKGDITTFTGGLEVAP